MNTNNDNRGPLDRIVGRLREAAKEISSAGHCGWGNSMTEAADEIERLQGDAARYRWLRDRANDVVGRAPMVFECDIADPPRWTDARHSDGLDAAIDAAMKQDQTPNAEHTGATQ